MCKIAPRKYVHMLLILSELIIIGCCILMIILNRSKDWNKIIWMNSKALTIKQLMKINNNESYPIRNIYIDGSTTHYWENYTSLLAHSGEKCEEHYKKCGKLDSLGNIMCIPENDDCPINDIKVDLASNNTLYESKGYKSTSLVNLSEGYVLYYTNNSVDKEIITKLSFSNETPLFINQDNFIFDEETYSDSLTPEGDYDGYDYDGGSWDSGGDWGGGGDWDGGGSGGGGWRRLKERGIYGTTDVINYMRKEMGNETNIDKTFKKIYDNIWAGTFIGFKDNSNMNEFNKVDMHETYISIFPKYLAYLFCFVNIGYFLAIGSISVIRFLQKDKPNEEFNKVDSSCCKYTVIVHYSIFFLPFFVYIVYEYVNIYKKENLKI